MESTSNLAEGDFVVFDVIGIKYRLKKYLFKKYQRSLFFKLIYADASQEKCPSLPECVAKLNADEFYVQRCPDLVKIVLEYCINEKLHVPEGLCREQVAEEFQFWNIKYEILCDHCASRHYHSEVADNKKAHSKESTRKSRNEKENFFQYCRNFLWTFMEHPHSSSVAFVFFIASVAVIVVSILNIILASIPELQYCPQRNDTQIEDDRKAQDESNEFRPTDCVGTFVFNVVDMFCMSWFSLELLLRFISCPKYKQFFLSAFFIIDFLSVLPFYVELLIFVFNADDSDDLEKLKAILMFLRIFRLFRIFQILKFARYSLSLKVLGKTLVSAKADLGMLSVFILLALLIFSNFLYQLEKDVPGSLFTSIPATFWWCIVTLTTVGYGDMYPQTILGKIIAGVTCVCGVLLVAFPIAILVEKFISTYKEQKEKEQAKHRHKRYRNLSSMSVSRSHSSAVHRQGDTNDQNKTLTFDIATT